MSSSGGIRTHSGPATGATTISALLQNTVTAAGRALQARLTLSLLALALFGVALLARRDIPLAAVSGGAGSLALAYALSREPAIRLLLAALSWLAIIGYAWAAFEDLPVVIAVRPNAVSATVGDSTVAASVPQLAGSRLAISIDSTASQPGTDLLSSMTHLGNLLFFSNAAQGAIALQVTDGSGRQLTGATTFWEPDDPFGPPLVDGDGLVLPLGERYQLISERPAEELFVRFSLRNGGPPTTLIVGLDGQLNGIAIRCWPWNRGLSIHELRGGQIGRELAGGYQSLRKPELQGLQMLVRELSRSWLVALAVLALGCVAMPAARLMAVPADWRAPSGSGSIAAVGLSVIGLAATAMIASDVLERIPHVQDSVAYLFQAKSFALGRMTAPLPPVPEAFAHEFILMFNDQWFSKYPPGFPTLLMLGVLVDAPWLVSPMTAMASLLLVYGLGRELHGVGAGILGVLLLVTSPFFLFMSGSFMSHPAGLMFTLAGLLFTAQAAARGSNRRALVAGIALGWLAASRQLTGVAIGGVALVFLAIELFRSRRSLEPLLWWVLGWSWPVLLLLAYNRATTGHPLLNPFELWWDFDRVGFGPAVGMHGGHDLGRGLWNVFANLRALEQQLYGWPVFLTLSFALVPFITARARAGDLLFAGVTVALIVAYGFYWADGIMYGPRYYYEAAGCLALLTARGVLVAADASAGTVRSLLRRRPPPTSIAFYTLLVVGLMIGTVVFYLPVQVQAHRGYNYVNGQRLAVVRAAGVSNALILVPTSQPFAWWEYGSVFSANDPLLKGDVIYARDLDAESNRRTIAAFPSRRAYRLADGRLTPL